MSDTVTVVSYGPPIRVPVRAPRLRPRTLLAWAREWGIRTDKGGGALRRAWRRRGPHTVRGMVAAQDREAHAAWVRWAFPGF